jgi:hypothetical protein
MSYLTLADLGQATTVPTAPTTTGVRDLDAIDAAIVSAASVTGPLASSPSQNEARRRDLAAALVKASVSAAQCAASLAAIGWDAEPKAILAVKDGAERIVTSLAGKISWADLDSGVRSLSERLAAARAAIVARAAAEASAIQSRARAAIAGLAVKQPMTEEDWNKVAKVIESIQKDVALIGKLPLAKEDAPKFADAGSKLQGELDARLDAVSTAFMNAVEGAARKSGMMPQQGRWGAAWVERNKWSILGGLLVVGFALKGRG